MPISGRVENERLSSLLVKSSMKIIRGFCFKAASKVALQGCYTGIYHHHELYLKMIECHRNASGHKMLRFQMWNIYFNYGT